VVVEEDVLIQDQVVFREHQELVVEVEVVEEDPPTLVLEELVAVDAFL
jgi:hypothetical protein